MTLEVGSGGKKQQWTWIRKTSNPILATDPQCDHWVRCSAFLNLDCHNSLGREWHSDQQAWLVEMLEWGFMWKGQAWHLIGTQSIGIYKETFPRKTIKNKQEEKKEKNLKEKKKKKELPHMDTSTPTLAVSTHMPAPPEHLGPLSAALDQNRKVLRFLSSHSWSIYGIRREKLSSSCSQVLGSTQTHTDSASS